MPVNRLSTRHDDEVLRCEEKRYLIGILFTICDTGQEQQQQQ